MPNTIHLEIKFECEVPLGTPMAENGDVCSTVVLKEHARDHQQVLQELED